MKLSRRAALASSAGAAFAFAQRPSLPITPNSSDAVSEWIRRAAIPLSTPVAGHGFDDMAPLKKIVGDARIVALGEATHGTQEFFQLKHRMLEFLVTQMGFSIFSIEGSLPESYRLNDFVLKGEGDPAKLLKGPLYVVGHAGSARHVAVDARVQQIGQGPRGVHGVRYAESSRRHRDRS